MLGFIVNPVSGNGRGTAVWRQLKEELGRRKIPFVVRMTSMEGEAKQLAVEVLQKEGVTKIVGVGGDGTVNEVVNGIHEAQVACMFGHVPAGSGNDFARGHNLPRDPIQALERILQGHENEEIDLLQINGMVAINSVGAGLDGQVAKTANRARYKRWLNALKLGVLSYFLAVVRVLLTYKPCTVTVTVDSRQETLQNVWLIAVANIPNYGGGMMICPGAVPDDGSADICVVSHANRWSLLRAFPLIYSGKHVHHPAVRFFRGKTIAIQSERPLVVHADGELAGVTPITVNVAKRRLTLSK
jgi:diacylglycerol kinase (ATP)